MTSRTDSHTVRAPLPARADHPHTSGSRDRWLVLIAMTGALSMIMLDQTVVSVALPSMSRDLPLSAGPFARREFAGNLAVLGLVQFGLLAVVLFGSLYLQDLLRLSPIQAASGCCP